MWEKKGLIFNARKEYEWNQSHAQVPVVDAVNEKMWRIYYSTRNENNKSSCSYIEVEAGNPSKILYVHNKSILSLGAIGTFDDSGIMPTCIVNVGDKKYLYYIGWTIRATVPYHNSIGLAVSENGGTEFSKMFEGPILTTTHLEPYFCGTAFVLLEKEIWRMWYLSCTKWVVINNTPEPFYHIKYAESLDGVNWKREGIVAIDFKNKEEGGIVSASILKEDGKYKMWYGYRNVVNYRTDNEQSYRIGYAESDNGIKWLRKDILAGIDVTENEWDSEMISYPYVIKNNLNKFMFYNGNGFGKTGFGYAILKN